MVPAWFVEPDHARQLNVSLLEFWWLMDHGYSDRVAQFRSAWGILADHAAERQRADRRAAALRAQGYRGGPTDPRDSCQFKDEMAA